MKSNTLNEQEYLDLISRITGEQYDQLDDDEIEGLEDIAWTPANPEVKEKLFRAGNTGSIDLTNTKKSQILDSLFKHNNIKVYDFLIRITKYHGEVGKVGATITVDIEVYDEIHKTPLSNIPCKMLVAFDIKNDNRFINRPWLSQFSWNNGKNIDPDTLVDIIRWMQVVKKLSAFL